MEESSPSVLACADSLTPTTIIGERTISRNGEGIGPMFYVVDCSSCEDEPNEETLEAMAEIERSINNPSLGKRYTNAKAMMAELLADAGDCGVFKY